MPLELEYIQAFSPLFARIQQIRSPLGATAYYIFLITKFPTNFKTIYREAKKAMAGNINPSKMIKGRQDLLENGFVAEVLLSQEKLDRETYLPISPEFVWQDNKRELEGIIGPEGLAIKYDMVKHLQKIYEKNFGKYGIRIENESITVFHNSLWLLYFIAYNTGQTRSLQLLLGSLRSFKEPYIKYYEDMLAAGIKTKIIFNPANTGNQNINNILRLKEKYPDNIEIRANPISYGTSRRVIFDSMAIDGKKLMGLNSDLSYISTIYFQGEIVHRIKDNFEKAWDISKPLELNIKS